jgi:hypothetical protein
MKILEIYLHAQSIMDIPYNYGKKNGRTLIEK